MREIAHRHDLLTRSCAVTEFGGKTMFRMFYTWKILLLKQRWFFDDCTLSSNSELNFGFYLSLILRKLTYSIFNLFVHQCIVIFKIISLSIKVTCRLRKTLPMFLWLKRNNVIVAFSCVTWTQLYHVIIEIKVDKNRREGVRQNTIAHRNREIFYFADLSFCVCNRKVLAFFYNLNGMAAHTNTINNDMLQKVKLSWEIFRFIFVRKISL